MLRTDYADPISDRTQIGRCYEHVSCEKCSLVPKASTITAFCQCSKSC